VNRLLVHPDPVLKLQIKTLGSGDARLLLEYQAARQSRWYFEVWALAQIVLGGVFFFFMLFATGEGKVSLLLALSLLAEVLGQQLLLVPGLLSMGRLAGEGPGAGGWRLLGGGNPQAGDGAGAGVPADPAAARALRTRPEEVRSGR
jgi:hypothetical protein